MAFGQTAQGSERLRAKRRKVVDPQGIDLAHRDHPRDAAQDQVRSPRADRVGQQRPVPAVLGRRATSRQRNDRRRGGRHARHRPGRERRDVAGTGR